MGSICDRAEADREEWIVEALLGDVDMEARLESWVEERIPVPKPAGVDVVGVVFVEAVDVSVLGAFGGGGCWEPSGLL